ncbi:MAG: alcohol dehydrogenase catalytic domain-containing protein [Polyangiales bacterium]
MPSDEWVRLAPDRHGRLRLRFGHGLFQRFAHAHTVRIVPFVPGHEVLARVTEVGKKVDSVREGDRVAVDPWLRCGLRGHADCNRCEVGEYNTCESNATEPRKGMMIGACADLPGGWCEEMVAHHSQLFTIPNRMSDDRAVLMEPMAVAVHAVARNLPRSGERVLILGGGAIAFSVSTALRTMARDFDLTLFTLENDQAQLAKNFGANRAWTPQDGSLVDRAAEMTGAHVLKPILGSPFLAGGFDLVFDCAGNQRSIADSMGVARSGARIVMVGAAGVQPKLDLTHLWTKELQFIGTLSYSHENFRGERRRTFDLTREILQDIPFDVESLITHRYPLHEYQSALRANLNRSESHAIKTVIVGSAN